MLCLKASNATTAKAAIECNAYPNPIEDNDLIVEIDSPMEGDIQLSLTNIQGREVHTFQTYQPKGFGSHTLPTAQLPTGTYVLVASNSAAILHRQLIIIK